MGRNESGSITVTLSSSEGLSDTITFDDQFPFAPSVVASILTDVTTGKHSTPYIDSLTPASFKIGIRGDNGLGSVEVHWIAMERRPSEKAAQ